MNDCATQSEELQVSEPDSAPAQTQAQDPAQENEDPPQENQVPTQEDQAPTPETDGLPSNMNGGNDSTPLPATLHLGTLFGQIREPNVTFCIDTSGSMVHCLEAVKDHVIAALHTKAGEETGSMFNLIEFSTHVAQWSDKMVRCTPQTVAVATKWVKTLQPKTGTNTLEALLAAFCDAACEAVCLVTDGLPDQNATEILDAVVYAAQNRPVHCYYINEGNPDSAATEFLQDLAMETYGSFHIITVCQDGIVEHVTPVYRAEAAAERIIRTTDGNIYPSNHKVCSVSARLDAPPNILPGPHTLVVQEPPLHPYYMYPWPYRFYYHYHYPGPLGWSRYRPARALLGHELDFYNSMIHVCPGAGSLVVGTKVLARRHDDGLFYVGTVKSQILNNKFLVEMGPCKHGKYRDTSYQETYIYDIVSYEDALRHAVLSGDRVLAPWEPDGERFGPGVVVEGQERRTAKGGLEDMQLVVAFYNGKTVKVPLETALWIPTQLYDRIAFEVQLPSHVRRDFANQEEYPEENLPGYPTSGPKAVPRDYETYRSHWVPSSRNVVIERGMYQHPYYVPLYPIYYKNIPKPSEVKSEEVEEIIPGTEMTKAQLNEKVMSQLMQHKLTLSGKTSKETNENKLLNRRENVQESNTVTKKSVTFDRSDSDLEAEFDAGDLEMRDSGRGSGDDDLYLSDLEDTGKEDAGTQTRDVGAGPDARLYYRKVKRRADKRPPWRYWSNDPAPDLMDPMHYGAYRVGPYEESFIPPPLERKSIKVNPEGVEWTSSVGRVVDPFARHKYEASVRDSMHIPHPPKYKPEKQGPGRDLYEVLGTPVPEAERLAISRMDFRRKRALQRELDWLENTEEQHRMRITMDEQSRDRAKAHREFECERRAQEWEQLQQAREAKKNISEDIRARIEERQAREKDIEGQRLAARVANRERREEIVAQRQREIEETVARRQAIKEQNAQRHWDAVQIRMAEKEAEEAAAVAQRRAANQRRIDHFRQLEATAQLNKQLRSQMSEIRQAHTRSKIFS